MINRGGMADLLEAAGFHVHGRRASCAHCEGHSRLTVSFNEEVYYCHRCGRRGNLVTLSCQLGRAIPQQTPEERKNLTLAREFAVWRTACHVLLIHEWEHLCQKADLARRVLAVYPDCEPAWDALKRFYDAEADFCASFDLLCYEPLSRWLERPMTKEKLRAGFDEAYCEEADAA